MKHSQRNPYYTAYQKVKKTNKWLSFALGLSIGANVLMGVICKFF